MSANGMQADYLTSLFGNGPVTCGAVVDQDTFTATKDGIKLADTVNATVSATHAALVKVCNARVAAICAAGAGLLQSRSALLDPTAVSSAEPVWATAANASANAKTAEPYTLDSIKEATLIALRFIVAAKVNYWKTNHHTGSPKPSGYFLKALKLSGLDDIGDADISALWRLVHWADTRVILSVLGIRGITAKVADIREAAKIISPSEDVVLRIRSAPAGTAKWADVWAGIKIIEGSNIYSAVGPAISRPRADCTAIYDSICSGDPSFHMGSMYLCGLKRVTIEDWSPIVIGWVRTCLDDFDSNSTLLKAAVFSNVEPVTSMVRRIRALAVASNEKVRTLPLGLTWGAPLAIAGKPKPRKAEDIEVDSDEETEEGSDAEESEEDNE